MISMRNFFLLLIPAFIFASCNNTADSNKSNSDSASKINADSSAMIDGHPAWIEQGNIYEVNVRQYTPEGTFNAFSNHLQRLKDMGVQTLWFMPINPISVVDRKESWEVITLFQTTMQSTRSMVTWMIGKTW